MMRETEIDLQKESPFFVYFSFTIVIMKLILARVLQKAQKKLFFFSAGVEREMKCRNSHLLL